MDRKGWFLCFQGLWIRRGACWGHELWKWEQNISLIGTLIALSWFVLFQIPLSLDKLKLIVEPSCPRFSSSLVLFPCECNCDWYFSTYSLKHGLNLIYVFLGVIFYTSIVYKRVNIYWWAHRIKSKTIILMVKKMH